MKERGVVTKIVSDGLVEVAFPKNEQCAHCCLCHEGRGGVMGIEVLNVLGAKLNDRVEVEISSEELIRGSMIVFLLPVFFLVGGYFSSSLLLNSLGFIGWDDVVGVAFAMFFLGLSFYFIKWYGKCIERKEVLRARIAKIIAP
jgi:sigma-E factor negative regulatory protein RseC